VSNQTRYAAVCTYYYTYKAEMKPFTDTVQAMMGAYLVTYGIWQAYGRTILSF